MKENIAKMLTRTVTQPCKRIQLPAGFNVLSFRMTGKASMTYVEEQYAAQNSSIIFQEAPQHTKPNRNLGIAGRQYSTLFGTKYKNCWTGFIRHSLSSVSGDLGILSLPFAVKKAPYTLNIREIQIQLKSVYFTRQNS